MNAAEVQLHHMARRHHATMQKLDGIRERFARVSKHAIGTAETGAGAWLGGLLDGRLQWPVSMSLVFGFTLTALDYLNMSTVDDTYGWRFYGDHYGNFGNGFLASYLARTGHRFGTRMMERSSATKIAARHQGAP